VKTVVIIVVIVLIVGGWLLIHARLRREARRPDEGSGNEDG
jgi:heme/copper-type cytochrome/quinol oxidase subunit 2